MTPAGPCSTSADENASAWIAEVSLSLSAASAATASVAPRPTTNREEAWASVSTTAVAGGAADDK